MFEDKELTCADCKDPFEWGVGEQEYYRDKGLQQPKRCKSCRDKKKAERAERGE